ncbi:MAG TPA: hypothetical protein PLU53_05470 [Bacteroidia bacterium]|nr:hypothetical protein [Bacteroidia bacterium]
MKYVLTLLFALTLTSVHSQSVRDQYDTVYTAGISARTLPGYSWYQTFTAGLSGNLDRVDIGFFNFISGLGTLEIIEGAGIGGNVLYSSQVNVSCPSGNCLLPFAVNCNVTSGSVYTIFFSPGNGIPDPYGVQADASNSYPGGDLYLIDPSGTYPFNLDLIFATYVKNEETGLQEATYTPHDFYSIVNSSVLLAENCHGELYSVEGKKVNLANVPAGIYWLRVTRFDRIYSIKIVTF